MKAPKIRRRIYKPYGDRLLTGEPLQETTKALKFQYYGWIIWLPKFAVTKLRDGGYSAPIWAIDSSKEHKSSKNGEAAEEYLYQRELSKEASA